MTSLTGESVRIYPMPVWQAVEQKLGAMPSTHPARLRFLDRVNYYGQAGEIDVQGRVLIQPRLRESASMTGEVDVLGQYDYLEVWNHERFDAKLLREPFGTTTRARCGVRNLGRRRDEGRHRAAT